MKVDKIIPCVCCDHKPDVSDSVYYGMPQLKVCGGKPETFFEYYCPNCGRGNVGLQYKSAYLALKAWNDMQERLWKIKEMTEVETNQRKEDEGK